MLSLYFSVYQIYKSLSGFLENNKLYCDDCKCLNCLLREINIPFRSGSGKASDMEKVGT